MRRYLPFAIVGVVGLLTVGSGAMLYRAKRPAALTIPKNREKSGLDQATHVRGNPKAPITLEEFGDFECPPCANLAPVITQIERDYGQELRVIFHHFPLMVHAHARQAAFAAEAAGLQDRFWEMHDHLYEHQQQLTGEHLHAHAQSVGLDLKRFDQDLADNVYAPRVREDFMSGVRSGVNGTPTFFINGVRYDGSHDLDSLLAAVRMAT